MADNVIPFIPGEGGKSEREPLKSGEPGSTGKSSLPSPFITTQCLRVRVSDGHLAAVFVSFDHKPDRGGNPRPLGGVPGLAPSSWACPARAKQFLRYFPELDWPPDPPGPGLGERHGSFAGGRLREDSQYDYKFLSASPTIPCGARQAGFSLAELLASQGTPPLNTAQEESPQ